MPSLFAVLYVPDFPVAALTRGERGGPPTVVADGEPPHQFIGGADEQARAAGVTAGMPLAAAQARHAYSGSGEE